MKIVKFIFAKLLYYLLVLLATIFLCINYLSYLIFKPNAHTELD